MQPDPEALKKRYASLSTEKLRELALFHAKGLRPEALEILREELLERGASSEVMEAIEIRRRGELSEGEFNVLAEKVRSLPCPHCRENMLPLNAVHIVRVKYMFIFTIGEKQLHIGCPECLAEMASKAMFRSLLMLVFAPITAIITWWKNFKTYERMAYEATNAELTIEGRAFIEHHSGVLVAHFDDEQFLFDYIATNEF